MTTPDVELPVGMRFLVRTSDPDGGTSRREGRPCGRRSSWPADYPERARALRADGLSCSMIGAELGGVPFNTVKGWLYQQQQAPV